MAKRVQRVFAIDISDQRNPDDPVQDNFDLIIYNGYDLAGIENGSIDIVFSDQLIEHFHPEDTKFHFELVLRILKPNGKYIFRTPHFSTGPHDISGYFSDVPEGFHLKEWSYHELSRLLREVTYSSTRAYWHRRTINIRMPRFYYAACEMVFGLLPKQIVRPIARYLVPSIYCVVVK